MLINFTVENYLSFRSPTNFSMVAAESVDYGYENTIPLPENSKRLLKSAVIYGANGAGKSNFIEALTDFRRAILESFSRDFYIDFLSSKYFKLDVGAVKKPVQFEMVFLLGSTLYRYGFGVRKGVVVSEWLYKKNLQAARETCCFTRDGQQITINSRSYKGAKGIPEKTRKNSLFISSCALFDVEEALEIKNWFKSQLVTPFSLNPRLGSVSEILELYQSDPKVQSLTNDFMKLTDVGIKDIELVEEPLELPDDPDIKKIDAMFEKLFEKLGKRNEKERKVVSISTEHSKYKNNKPVGRIKMPFSMESEGTQRAFFLALFLFNTLIKGKVLVLDEFGSNLHTQLSYEFLKLFQGRINQNSQLIIATHDTNLLRKDLFRRDQVWFAEKDKQANTDLYSLLEFKIDKNRLTEGNFSMEEDYLQGRYGAIPCFGNIDRFLREFSENE